MNKIMLVGKFTDELHKINKGLIGKYEVRACVNQFEIFESMFRVNEPEAIVMLIDEWNDTNRTLLFQMKMGHEKIPVVCVGIDSEKEEIPDYLVTKQFEYLGMPYTMESLIERIQFSIENKDRLSPIYEVDIEKYLKKYKDVKGANSTKENAIKSTKPKKVVMLVDDSGVHLRMIESI